MTRALVLLLAMAIASPAMAQAPTPAPAAGPSKEVCLESHSKGQDARDQGKLSLARKLFLTCAQAACPALVQGDCARFADDLGRTQPSVTFVARDGNGVDLPDTTVYVDEMLITTRVEGTMHEVDPGKHTIKFVHAGKEQVVTVVVGAGEKGRAVSATFGAPSPATVTGTQAPVKPAEPVTKTVRPGGAKVLMIAGGAVAIGGIALGIYGLSQMPSGCSIGSHECSAPPGDPVFDDASSAMTKINIGFIAGGVGVAASVAGLVWYFKGAKTTTESPEQQALRPWFVPGGGGISYTGRL